MQLPQKSDGTPDTANEHSDVIHDVLTFLAEEMTRLNMEKQTETRHFLSWLEKEVIKDLIEEQSNKTRITEFWENDLEALLVVLKKNKVIDDPYPSDKRDILENEFKNTLAIINPLRGKIKLTDELIDQVVFRLYCLTSKEITEIEDQILNKYPEKYPARHNIKPLYFISEEDEREFKMFDINKFMNLNTTNSKCDRQCNRMLSSKLQIENIENTVEEAIAKIKIYLSC